MKLDRIPSLLLNLGPNTKAEVENMLDRLPEGASLKPSNIHKLKGVDQVGKAYALFLTALRNPLNREIFDEVLESNPANIAEMFKGAEKWVTFGEPEFQRPRGPVEKIKMRSPGEFLLEFEGAKPWHPVWEISVDDETFLNTNGKREYVTPMSMWDVPTDALKLILETLAPTVELAKSIDFSNMGAQSTAFQKMKLAGLVNKILTERPSLEKRFADFLANPHGSLVGQGDLGDLSKIAAKVGR